MKTIIFSLLLLISQFVYGFDVSIKNRVANEKPGYCMWASIETIGRERGIEKLFGLVESRKKDPPDRVLQPDLSVLTYAAHGGPGVAVSRKLDKLKVRNYIQYEDNFDKNVLSYANEYGCVIGIKPYMLTWPNPNVQAGYHAILLTKYSPDEIGFIDSNFPDKTFVGKREWLDKAWTGMAVIIDYPTREHPAQVK